MLLRTLPLRRYAPRLGYLVATLEGLRADAVRPIPWSHAARRLATAAANPVDGKPTFHQSAPCDFPEWQDDDLPERSSCESDSLESRNSKFFDDWSPSKALRQWLTKGFGVTGSQIALQKSAAASPSARLPIVALQVDMMRAENSKPTSLSDHLITEDVLVQKLEYLASKDVTMEDIELWLWILRPQGPGMMARRLCRAHRPLPPFVVLLVLNFRHPHKDPGILSLVYEYVSRAVFGEVASQSSSSESLTCQINTLSEATQLAKSSTEYRYRWTPRSFLKLLRLMVHHSLRAWPESLPSIARLAERYIETIAPPERKGILQDLAVRRRQNKIHNAALVIFSNPARRNSLANLKHNWEAQKIILGLSAKLSHPPLIDQAGFRAIQSVLGGLRKSKPEQFAASRLSKAWPPYRQAWDGLDEQRPLEDDYSRSVKAGILAREAGYVPQARDRALDVLGGADLGNSPFISFRTIAPKRGMEHNSTVIMPWAASIRATRNAHEAWQAFLRPPQADLPPCAMIYTEMFTKLYARAVDKPDILPGTSLESHPVPEANLSEFEKARLQPPRPSALYEQMRAQGVRPVGACLLVLLRNAKSLKEIARYLEDGLQDELASRTFVGLVDRRMDQPNELYEADHIVNMPLQVFEACAIGVTKLMPYTWVQQGLTRKFADTHRLLNLINITKVRMRHEQDPSIQVWHVIFNALASPGIAVLRRPRGMPPEVYETENRIKALDMFMRVFHHVRETTRVVDIFMFEKLCLILRRATTAIGFKRGQSRYFDEVIGDAHAAVKATAASLSGRIDGNAEPHSEFLKLPSRRYPFGPAQIRSYFRTLAYLGDHEELLNRLEWIIGEGVRADGQEGVLDTAKDPDHPDHERLYTSLVIFKAYMSHHLSSGEMQTLKERMIKISEDKGLALSWPDDEDVAHFMNAERNRGDEAAFWEQLGQRRREKHSGHV